MVVIRIVIIMASSSSSAASVFTSLHDLKACEVDDVVSSTLTLTSSLISCFSSCFRRRRPVVSVSFGDCCGGGRRRRRRRRRGLTMFHVWPPSHHSRRPGISVSLVSQWFLWGVPFVWYLCFLVLPLLLQVAHGQQTSPIGATDVRLYTPASVLGKVDVHVGSIAGRNLDWQAWRTNALATSPPDERAFNNECLKDARVLVRTRDKSTCTCNANDVEALVRLRRASTKIAGLAQALQSTQCLVNVKCSDDGAVNSVTVTRCALASDVDVTLPGGSTKLRVEMLAFDSSRRRVELFAAIRGGSNDGALYAKAAYQVSTSQDAGNDGALWQVATQATTTLGEVAATLGAPYANFHRRFSLPRAKSSRASVESVAVTSFVAKLSARRSVVAAAIAFHDDDLGMDVYATGQVDGDGRLNAYEVRRVKGALTLREVAGGIPAGELYVMDHDVCGAGWDEAATEQVYLSLDGVGGNRTSNEGASFMAQGQVQLTCSGFQQPPVPFSEATFVAPVMHVPSHLIDNVCCLGGEDVELDRTTLRYEDAYARANLVSSFGAKQVLHVTGRKIIQASSYLIFSSVGVVGDNEIAFKLPSFHSPNALPISQLSAVVNDDIDALITSGIPRGGASKNGTSLLANFEIASSPDGSNTVLRLSGEFEGNAGSFTSKTTLRAGSCKVVESFEGSWRTASGDVATFDATGDLCHKTKGASSAGGSSYVRGDGRAVTWAPSLSTSNAWTGVTSAVCNEVSEVQAYRIDATAAESDGAEVAVSIGLATIKSDKITASLRTDSTSVLIHTTNKWASQGITNPPEGYVSMAFEESSGAPTVVVASPTTGGIMQSNTVVPPRAINFVDSTLRLIGAVGQLNDLIPGACNCSNVPKASSVYEIMRMLRFTYDQSDCTIDVEAAFRSVKCAGRVAEANSDDIESNDYDRMLLLMQLRGRRASVVSHFIEKIDGTEAAAMFGISAERDGAVEVLSIIDRSLVDILKDEIFVQSSSVIIASAAGIFANVNLIADERNIPTTPTNWRGAVQLGRSQESSPMCGANGDHFSPGTYPVSGRNGVNIPKAGVYVAGRLDRSRGMMLKLSEMNTQLSRRLIDAIFYSSCGNSAIGLASLENLYEPDAVQDSRLQYATKLRGKLVWPDAGLVLLDGGSIVTDVNGKMYTKRTLLRGKYVFEFEHVTPIDFNHAPGGGGDANGIVWVRAEGDLEIKVDTETGNPFAGGLLKFTKLGKDADPDSLFLSPAIKFREGTVGIRTEFQTPYLDCFGLAVSSSWSMLPRDQATPVEEYYRHEVRSSLLHFAFFVFAMSALLTPL